MKVLVLTLLAVIAAVNCKSIDTQDVIDLENNFAYNYHSRTGISSASKLRELEAKTKSRIAGGSGASLGQFSYQAGLVIQLPGGESLCGAAIIGSRRVLTAAHCWFDGWNQATMFTVVVGSILVFSGGQRLQTSNVIMHSGWNWNNFHNDIAMIFPHSDIIFNNNVAPVTMPSGSQLTEDFVGDIATVSGFGYVVGAWWEQITPSQGLRYVNVSVIPNSECNSFFNFLFPAHICTSGEFARGPCGGDSGGPLVVTRNGNPLLIGIVNFGHIAGCTSFFPSGYARVTAHSDWIRSLL